MKVITFIQILILIATFTFAMAQQCKNKCSQCVNTNHQQTSCSDNHNKTYQQSFIFKITYSIFKKTTDFVNIAKKIVTYIVKTLGKVKISTKEFILGVSIALFSFAFIVICYLLIYISCCMKIDPQLIRQYQQMNNEDNQINKVIQITYDWQKDYCSFCWNDGCDLILQCNHYFHLQCFKQWMKLNLICPICRSTAINRFKIIICMDCRSNCMIVSRKKVNQIKIENKCECKKQIELHDNQNDKPT